MKKWFILSSLLCLVAVTTSCSNQKGTTDSSSSQSVNTLETSVVNTSEQEASKENVVLEGTLAHDAKMDEKNITSVLVKKIQGIKDPDDIQKSMEKDGLILNIPEDRLIAADLTADDLKNGTRIEFTITSNAAMTFSLPPQLMGDSLVSLKVLK
ncbi:hypothetical protein CBF34_05155 [Vagococcus penaei]|uniref:Uncharacterized protein n=1 Tax=Vagococcus penaei TaxID=633807 RepID=A0A1Q2D680_9ENTE|nr:hypothetical protein [Vagococcus penaei]AQP53926.1 hypothetical protein BW732_06630 [Vagococcus penaei]RSU02910.1 hypothetical protein CBF34_05155 [Vagococcus penaei]